MFATQRRRMFPLPDYAFEATPQGLPRVELMLCGQVLDPNSARALMARGDLALEQVLLLLLDRVRKGQPRSPEPARALKDLGLIEGWSPRLFISAKVADAAEQKARYAHNRGLDDAYYQRLVLDYLHECGQAVRADLDALLLAKLPDVLDAGQKANKVKNLPQDMRRAGLVHPEGPRSTAIWRRGPGG